VIKTLENNITIIALGGNAILPKGARGTPGEQWRAVEEALKQVAKIIEENPRIVITHGNGPQVGYLIEAFESLPPNKPRQTLDIAVARTQGWIGYLIAHSLEKALGEKKLGIAGIVTRVMVSRKDPAFSNPTKYIGSYYSKEDAERIARERGWVMKPDPRGGYRRVVPSPHPLRILEATVVRELVDSGTIVVAVGGGGIPVDEEFNPVEAVIDKDLASARLGIEIGAKRLVILTDVQGVAINYGKPDQQWLEKVTVSEIKRYYNEGQFPPGSMGPKVLASIEFVEASGGVASIGSLRDAYEVYRMNKGTHILPG
jgi:carbamate kinase